MSEEDALAVVEVEPALLVDEEPVAAVVADAAVPAVVDDVAPIEASASNTAAIRPPPGGGGGGEESAAAVLEPDWSVFWFCRESMVDKADGGMESPLPLTELMLLI